MANTKSRKQTLKELKRTQTGLEKLHRQLIRRLAAAKDINDALDIRHRLDMVNVKLVENVLIQDHLEAAVAVKAPTAELVKTVDTLLQKMAQAQWQSLALSKTLRLARSLTIGFGRAQNKLRARG